MFFRNFATNTRNIGYGPRMLRLSLPLAPVFLIATPAAAQQEDQQVWFQVNGAVDVGESSRLTLEGISRFGHDVGGVYSEAGLLYTRKLGGGVEVSLGYRHVEEFSRGGPPANDERIRQMVQAPLGSGFVGRLRFEQRFNSTGSEVGLRLRPRLNYDTALPNTKVRLYFAQEHYFILNDTKWGQERGYERIRNSAGLAIPLTKEARAEVGYLNQLRFGRNGKRPQMDHALMVTLNLNIARIGDAD